MPIRSARAACVHAVFAAGLSSLLAAGFALRQFPPDRYPLYPRCPFHELTGLLCPGCGATHALAAMAGGHWAAAWAANPLAVLFLPALLVYGLLSYRRALDGQARPWPQIPSSVVGGLTVASVLFAIARNVR